MTAASLEALLEVQDLDLALDQIRHRIANLAERAELQAAAGRQGELRSRREETAAEASEAASRQEQLEAELAATEERAATVRRRLYGGEVSASRELQAMATDLEGLRARASALEERVLEAMEVREALDARAGAIGAELETVSATAADLEGRARAAESALEAELGDLSRSRGQAAARVPADLLASYEAIRARRDGVGAARLVQGRCDGCHLTLSAMELERIKRLPDDEVPTCEQCGRILVRP